MSFLLRLSFDNLPKSKHNPGMSNATTNRTAWESHENLYGETIWRLYPADVDTESFAGGASHVASLLPAPGSWDCYAYVRGTAPVVTKLPKGTTLDTAKAFALSEARRLGRVTADATSVG